MIETMRTWCLLRSLRAGSRHSPEGLHELQERLLRTAVASAYQNVPFYQRLWNQEGFDPASVLGIGDLRRIPIIGGREVRDAVTRGELLARGVDTARCATFPTSGSSAAPLRVWRRDLERRLWRVALWRMLFEHGFRWWHATVQFDPPPGSLHVLQRLGISRTTWIPNSLPIDRQLVAFVEARAHVVAGTPTALRRICRALDATGRESTKPRIVFCCGEVLDLQTRATVKRVLGIDPLDVYGLTEVGYVAWQCEERRGLHVNSELYLVEVLRDGRPAGPGELGTIVVTDLRGRTMPLVRYDTGDLAIAATGPCSCGRRLPLVGSIEGRRRASVQLADGRVVSNRAIMDHLAGTLPLGEYRLHHDAGNRFRLELAPSVVTDEEVAARRGPGRVDQAKILSSLHELLGEVDISIEAAKSWNSDGAEKTHTVFSAVPIHGV